jgi:hypothetical protein
MYLAPKAQHSPRAWGNAPGSICQCETASAESAIQLWHQFFSGLLEARFQRLLLV